MIRRWVCTQLLVLLLSYSVVVHGAEQPHCLLILEGIDPIQLKFEPVVDDAGLASDLSPLLRSEVFGEALVATLTRGLQVPFESVVFALKDFKEPSSSTKQLELIRGLVFYFSEQLVVNESWGDSDQARRGADALRISKVEIYRELSRHWYRILRTNPNELAGFLRDEVSSIYSDESNKGRWVDSISVRRWVEHVVKYRQSNEKVQALAIPDSNEVLVKFPKKNFLMRSVERLFFWRRYTSEQTIRVPSFNSEFEPILSSELIFESDFSELEYLKKELLIRSRQLSHVSSRIRQMNSFASIADREMRTYWDKVRKGRNGTGNSKPLDRYVQEPLDIIDRYKSKLTVDEVIKLVEFAQVVFNSTASYLYSGDTANAGIRFYRGLQKVLSSVYFENVAQLEKLLETIEFYTRAQKGYDADFIGMTFEHRRQLRDIVEGMEWGGPPSVVDLRFDQRILNDQEASLFQLRGQRRALELSVRSLESRKRLLENRLQNRIGELAAVKSAESD